MKSSDLYINMDRTGENLGIVFPTSDGPTFRFRVEVDLPRHQKIRGVYVPLGNASRCNLFAYLRRNSSGNYTPESLPALSPVCDLYTESDRPHISAWLEALDLDGLLEPSPVNEAYTEIPVHSELWLPVTVRREFAQDNCAYPVWTDVLVDLRGLVGVLVYNTY